MSIDNCGQKVEIKTRPQRVLTVGTAAVENLDAAGASKYIVARTGEFGAGLPKRLASPPSDNLIVDPSDPTTEEILSSKPDLIYGYGLFNANVKQIQAAGITILSVQGECGHDETTKVDDRGWKSVTDDIRRLGDIFGTQRTADAAAQKLDDRIAAAQQPSTGKSAAWVYYFSSKDPIGAQGGIGISAAVLHSAGLSNTYADQKKAYLDISIESLIKKQPDWIVLSYGLYGDTEAQAKKRFLSEPGVSALRAVGANHIILVPAGASTSTPQAVDGLEEIVAKTRG